jgi:hypothetical protein
MTPHEQRHHPAAPDTDVEISVTAGAVTARWCPTCKAPTLLAGHVLVLTPGGVAHAGDWQWCEICDDPTYVEQETRRGQ